ncbi:hypothetical protein GJ744_011281 [Endocarpon pusillum]|uniref:Nudix hydrolase domain-containing protein n=1 Tax=Endocarpon pusillum TaxID=364733 RepID=A0A8H7APF2_9EURO|nr:hypothetical protein GJ744_011281 [Endocarpon pusillum]
MPPKSNLELIDECDNFPYGLPSPPSSYYAFIHATTSLGYISPGVFDKITWDPSIWTINRTSRTVELRGHDVTQRDRALASFLAGIRKKRVFRLLDGWRGELYPVYCHNRESGKKEVIMHMERAATPLFGVATYGVHMTAYTYPKDGETSMKIWLPRRAMTKPTYPGMMDNSVAGGIASGEKVLDCLIREASEEASLSEDLVRGNARPCGTVTYFHVRDERAGGETGLCMPECEYVYDLELPVDVVPVPGDDEAVDFRLLNVEEVKTALTEGQFKPNCALVLLDFFVRHGVLTPDNEPDYIEIVSRLHRRLEFPTA